MSDIRHYFIRARTTTGYTTIPLGTQASAREYNLRIKVQREGDSAVITGLTSSAFTVSGCADTTKYDFSEIGSGVYELALLPGQTCNYTISKDAYAPTSAVSTGLLTTTLTDRSGTPDVLLYGNKVIIQNEAGTNILGATVTTGDSYGTNCLESGSGVYFCAIPLSDTATDIKIVKDGYGTNTSFSFNSDRTNNTDSQISATAIINYKPSTPVLNSPDNNSAVSSVSALSAIFSDSDSISPTNTGKINFQVAGDSGFSNILDSGSSSIGLSSGQEGTYTPNLALEEGATYYWRAQNEDTPGLTSEWSSYRTFTAPCSYNFCETFRTTTYKDADNTTATWRTSASGKIAINFGRQQVVLDEPNLVSYWQMDNDWTDSKDSNNGTANGATFGTAKYGEASGSFDGNSDATMGTNILNFTSAVSVEAWIKETGDNSNGAAIVDNSSNNWGNGYGLAFTEPDTIIFFVNTGWGGNEATFTLVNDGEWHHVVGTYDGITIRIFVDGVEGTPYSYSDDIVPCTTAFKLGDGGGGSYTGLIDEAAVYNTALSATGDEVFSIKINSGTTNITKATLTKSDSGTIMYYLSNNGGATFEEATSAVEHTFSTTGNDLRWKAVLSGSEIYYIYVDYTEFVPVTETTPALSGGSPGAFSGGGVGGTAVPAPIQQTILPDGTITYPKSITELIEPIKEIFAPKPTEQPTEQPAKQSAQEIPPTETLPRAAPILPAPSAVEGAPSPSQTISGGGTAVTEKITDTFTNIITEAKASFNQTKETVQVAYQEVKRVANTPVGRATTKAAVVVPVAIAVAEGVAATMLPSVATTADLYSVLARMLGLLAEGLGIKKRARKWGIVYDSKTKRPIDPAHVKIIDENGKVVSERFTDMEGRFGFLVPPGRYRIEASKTHYSFPSKLNEKRDELYDNLYYGEMLDIKSSVADVNIPMDPVGIDWNEEIKKKIMSFDPNKEILKKRITQSLFLAGFILSPLVYWITPSPFNLAVIFFYFFVLTLKQFGFKPKTFGRIYDKTTGKPIPFAKIKVSFADNPNQIIASSVSDITGRYYILVAAKGSYLINVEGKPLAVEAPEKVINFDLRV